MEKAVAMKKAYRNASNMSVIYFLDDETKRVILENQMQAYLKRRDVKVSVDEVRSFIMDRLQEMKAATTDFGYAVRF